jgi:coatomer subunit epsilon
MNIHRLDLAEKTLKVMSEKNDDASITQLMTASLFLKKGEDKVVEAESIYQELIEKYSESVTLLNGKAIICMKQGRFEEANKLLLEALSKRNQDSETLINLVVCSQHLGKSTEFTQRYVKQLKNSQGSKNHPWVKNYSEMEKNFDEFCLQFNKV